MNDNLTRTQGTSIGISSYNPTTPEDLCEPVERLIDGSGDYSYEYLESKKAVMVCRDEKQLMCFSILKKGNKRYRLISKKELDAEALVDIDYNFHKNWFFKHCYESNDFGRLMNLAAKEVNV